MVIKRPDWGIGCFFSGKIVVTFFGGPPTSTARSWTSSWTWLPVIHGQEATKPKRLTSQKFMIRISKIWSPKNAGVFFSILLFLQRTRSPHRPAKGRTWKIFYPQKCQISNERSSVCLVYIGDILPAGLETDLFPHQLRRSCNCSFAQFWWCLLQKKQFLVYFLWWPQNHW